ncbi:alpha/beta fold hydrolase [Methyloversatilis thermotolerans]|uniref:alpha/beta fold hydrolase n=1 Tax=Methyloversatilis thermotolerans TaxID=1346290 RepID=UPI0003707BF3|nr:alpha/beta fold hydrolase [Methyloversatilis thermotolerans]
MTALASDLPAHAPAAIGVSLPVVLLLRNYFRLTSRVAPELARRTAERLFTTPPRPRRAVASRLPARRETVSAGRHDIAVWTAGPVEAPAVLLAHGWGGRGTQMSALAAALLDAGLRVVWYDQPGHGESGRARVGLPDFVHTLQALNQTHGPFAAAVGHSLGAAAIGLALRRGLRFGRAVFIGAPASIHEHTLRFSALIGLSPRVREAMRKRLERHYGLPFDEIDRIDELRSVELPALLVHDADDERVPFAHAQRLSSVMPRARLLQTWGLGHNRVLKDPATVAAVSAFVRGEQSLPPTLPPLPTPSPLY